MNNDNRQLINAFKELRGPGLFSPLDLHFADFVVKLDRDHAPAAVYAAAAMISHASSAKGHVCLNLYEHQSALINFFADLPSETIDMHALLAKTLPPPDWFEKLKASPAVGTPETKDVRPLIFDGKRLYLQKYFRCEQVLANLICAKAKTKMSLLINPGRIIEISPFLGPEADGGVNWQAIAVFAALYNSFTVITGPPGAGKTSITATICALLLEQNPDLRISLCAPTGKAQTVLKNAIRKEVQHLNCEDALKSTVTGLPVSTIHRLLGARRDSVKFRHNRENPLPLDVLIVDESSMAPLLLLTRLFEALPKHARIIMMGDKDQLASVESGAVLNDLSGTSELNHFSADFSNACLASGIPAAEKLPAASTTSVLTDCAVKLQKVFRFAPDRGIGLIQQRLSELPEYPSLADLDEIITAIKTSDPAHVTLRPQPSNQRELMLMLSEIVNELRSKGNFFMDEKDPQDALAALRKFIILSPCHSGLLGILNLNQAMLEVLQMPSGHYAHGTPLMVTENDYAHGLFNGDIGIVMQDKTGDIRAWFNNHHYDPDTANSSPVSAFPLQRLPKHQTAFAITIHKSQGSGFEQVLLMLPDNQPQSLTVRELFYTALTRTSERIDICGNDAVLQTYLSSRTCRTSGLSETLDREMHQLRNTANDQS